MEYSTSCPDWADKIIRGESMLPPPIFPERAEEALRVFKSLRIVDAAGSPTFGEASEEWIFDYVAAIFGAYDADTGRRLIRESLMMIPKKNSKSTIAAGILVTALVLNWRQSADLIFIAPTIQIANNAWQPARDMVRADPELNKLMHLSDHTKTMTHRLTNAKLRVIAAEADTVGGIKASWVLVDEVWLFGKREKAGAMLTEATGGLISRPEGIVILLTTQADEPPAGVFKEKLALYRDIRDGRIQDNTRLPLLFEHPPHMVESGEAMDVENLYIVNPNIGRSVDMETLRDYHRAAVHAGPGRVRDFFAKHGNVEVGLNLRSDRWPGADFWEAAGVPMTLDYILDRADVVTVGLDGGGLDDLLGLSVLARDRASRKWYLWVHAWAHRIVLSRRQDIASRLLDAERDGDLTLVDLPGDDVREVCDIIASLNQRGLLPQQHAVGVDAAGISSIIESLTSDEYGLKMEQISAVSQGWRLTGAIKTTERAIAGKTMIHCAQPLMAWCVGNAKVVVGSSGINVSKAHSGSAKIDPLMSTFNAVSLMALNPMGSGGMDNWLESMAST